MKLSRIFILTLVLAAAGFFSVLVKAQTVDEIKDKIAERNNNIKQLEEEIKGYQVQINDLGKQAGTLRNTLLELDVSQRKLQANLALTQAKIDKTNQDIKDLGAQ